MTLRRAAAAVLLLFAIAPSLHASSRYDPRLKFRTISTARFDIHFHQGEDALARRLARIAEDVADRLDDGLGRPHGRVHVVLVAQTDLANGWATPVPYNLIEITAVPPPGDSTIGNTDDWLRLVFSHEYTHIVHLDAARGWIGGLRRVFGRLPVLFPNLSLPLWQIEGIATYSESAVTGQGRVPGGDFRMMLEEAGRSRRFDPLDRASGRLVDWPAGNAPYLYGGYFHQYLADRFGADSLVRLSKETAGRLPYFGAPAFRKIFGRSLGVLWGDFEADTRARAVTTDSAATRLTRHGFVVVSPRFSADGHLFYSVRNPHAFPALMTLPRGSTRPRKVTTRYLGGRLSASGDLLVFDQLELIRDVALQSDLYAVAKDGGRARRLTRGARAADPDVSPDGELLVCTVQQVDRRELATLSMRDTGGSRIPATLISEADTEFSAPRWSPDGRTIVAERRRLGGPSELVIVDPRTRHVRTIVTSARGRNVSPVWLPDGASVLFASDRHGGPFALYAATVTTGALRRLRGTGTGAESPAISPDGRTLVFVGYTADGFDLFSLPFQSAVWLDVPTAAAPISSTGSTVDPPATVATYRPWRTLAPYFWVPTLESDAGETRAGVATAATDALGRHTYLASLGWSRSRLRPDWELTYVYDRWRPTLFADVADDTDPWRSGQMRSLESNAGAFVSIRRVRWTSTMLAALHVSNEHFDCTACEPGIDRVIARRALRFGWHLDRSKSYGYSISAEDGGRVTVASEFERRALGADGDGGSITADVRGYLRIVPRHGVAAGRVAAATAWGDRLIRRQFTASGSGPASTPMAFGVDAIGLLRGFDDGAVLGNHAVVANADYRFPLLDVQRGVGTLPFFLRAVHGAVFADVGHAWTTAFRSSEMRKSIGAELSLDTIIGYTLPVTLTGGAAWRDDPVGNRRGVVTFGRIGRAF